MSSPNLHSDCDYTQQISDYYRYQLQQVSDKFK